MNESSVKTASIIWVIGLVLTGFLLSIPPDDLVFYVILAGISLIPLLWGSRRYQFFGVIALAISIFLAVCEIRAGQERTERKQRTLKQFLELQMTNASQTPPVNK
jgi:membrane protein implicated in regulation of membrane protease activity